MQMSPCPPLTFGEFSEQPVTIVPSRLLETLIPTLKSQSLIFSPLEITRRIEKGLHAMVKKKIILHRHWQIQFRDHSGLVGMIIFVSHFSFSLKKTITVMLMWHSLESVQELNRYICWPITDISASAYTVSRLHYRSLWQVFDHHIGRVTAKNVYILAYI